MRLWLLLVVAPLVGCAPDPASHCEERQRFWATAYAHDDPAEAERMASHFVPSCTKLLSKPDARSELVCRDRCLRDARKDAQPGSREAKEAYTAFSGCEAVCLGGKPGPQPVSP